MHAMYYRSTNILPVFFPLRRIKFVFLLQSSYVQISPYRLAFFSLYRRMKKEKKTVRSKSREQHTHATTTCDGVSYLSEMDEGKNVWR